jgi:hypothetical protein
MKNIILIFLITFTLSCCDKDDNNCQGIDCLPPATQTGAGTFGCLVNGVPYVDNSGFFNCFYQFVDGEYYFNISPNFNNKIFRELDLGSRDINFSNISFFDLAISNDGGGSATFSVANELRDISTNLSYNGICQITYFNNTANIISGTFEFEIFDEVTQTLYVITEGRFDAQFTQ